MTKTDPDPITGEVAEFQAGVWLYAELVDLRRDSRPAREGKAAFTRYVCVCRINDRTIYVDYWTEEGARQAVQGVVAGEMFWQSVTVRAAEDAAIYYRGNLGSDSGPRGESIL